MLYRRPALVTGAGEAKMNSRWVIYGIVAIAIVLLVLMMRWQRSLQSVPAGLEVEPITAGEMPRLNQDSLSALTGKIETIGCIPVADGHLTADVGDLPPTFVRLFHQPQADFYLLLSQQLPIGHSPRPWICTLISVLDEGWMILTTDQSPDRKTNLLQLDQHLWSSHPGAAPEQLMQFHQQLRSQVVKTLRVPVLTDLTPNGLWIKLKERAWRQKQIAKRQNMVTSFLKTLSSSIKPRYEWLGAYGSRHSR
jgi:hypothetical protein